jgi:hypothetical protein
MGQYYQPTKIDENGEVVAWVYSHDYNNGLKLMEHSYIGNNFVEAVESQLIPSGDWYQSRLVWAGDYADANFDDDTNYNSRGTDENKINPKPLENSADYPFICNFDTKQFVDKRKCTIPAWEGADDLFIHPLPLLTADGNGRGGGDYRGSSNLVGSWIGNRIGLEKEIPEGFIELEVSFTE